MSNKLGSFQGGVAVCEGHSSFFAGGAMSAPGETPEVQVGHRPLFHPIGVDDVVIAPEDPAEFFQAALDRATKTIEALMDKGAK